MTLAVRSPRPGQKAPAGGDTTGAPVEPVGPAAAPPRRSEERRRSPQRRRRVRRDALLFGALIAPNLIAIIVFSYYPALYNIGLSFFEWDFVAPSPEWVGLGNYTDLFTDASFGQVLMNTLIFTGVSVVGSLVLGLLLGSLLATKVPFTGFAQQHLLTAATLAGGGLVLLACILGTIVLPVQVLKDRATRWVIDPRQVAAFRRVMAHCRFGQRGVAK